MKNTSHKIWIGITCILFNACGPKTPTSDAPAEIHAEDNSKVELTSEQFEIAGVKLGKIEKRNLSGVIKATGMLDVPPQNLVTISPPVAGFIKETELLQGMKINRGDVLAVLEHSDYIDLQQNYLENKSQLAYLEAESRRQDELYKENVNAQKTMQEAKAKYEGMKAKVAGLKAKLEMININIPELENGVIKKTIRLYSPIHGYVTKVSTNIGAFVTPSDILFEIVDTDHLHVELTVFERDIPKIRIGQKVRLILANETSERTASVYLLGREIGPDRTVRIHCHLDQEDAELLPGMFLNAKVETGTNEVFALPEKAIVDFEGNKYIFISTGVDSNSLGKDKRELYVYEWIPVSTGISDNGYTEVVLPEKYNPADLNVVINGAYSILSKMKNTGED